MKTVGVIGAGQMGAGIAQVSAQAGYAVLLSDRDLACAEEAKRQINRQLARAVEREKITASDAQTARARRRSSPRPMPKRRWPASSQWRTCRRWPPAIS